MTNVSIIFIIVCALATYVPLGGWAVFQLIQAKADPALIAVMSGLVGTALGGLMSMLNNTRTTPSTPAGTVADPVKVETTNTTANPVITSDTHNDQ